MKSIRNDKTIIKRFHVKNQQVFLLFLDFLRSLLRRIPDELCLDHTPKAASKWMFCQPGRRWLVEQLDTRSSLIGQRGSHFKERQCRSVIYLENRKKCSKASELYLSASLFCLFTKVCLCLKTKISWNRDFVQNFANFQVLIVDLKWTLKWFGAIFGEYRQLWRWNIFYVKHFWQNRI